MAKKCCTDWGKSIWKPRLTGTVVDIVQQWSWRDDKSADRSATSQKKSARKAALALYGIIAKLPSHGICIRAQGLKCDTLFGH